MLSSLNSILTSNNKISLLTPIQLCCLGEIVIVYLSTNLIRFLSNLKKYE